MNLPITLAAVTRFRRLKLQHVLGVSGLVLALCASVAVGVWQGEAGRPARAVNPRFTNVNPEPGETLTSPHVVYYLVSSEEQADSARDVERSTNALRGVDDPSRAFRAAKFVVVHSPEQEALVRAQALYTAQVSDVTHLVVDLRRP